MRASIIKCCLRVDSHALFARIPFGQAVTTVRQHEDVTAHQLPKDVCDRDAMTHVACGDDRQHSLARVPWRPRLTGIRVVHDHRRPLLRPIVVRLASLGANPSIRAALILCLFDVRFTGLFFALALQLLVTVSGNERLRFGGLEGWDQECANFDSVRRCQGQVSIGYTKQLARILDLCEANYDPSRPRFSNQYSLSRDPSGIFAG